MPLCVNVKVPVRVPPVVGAKVTDTVQVPLTATVAQLLVCEKSLTPEDTATLETTKGEVPVFVSVTTCAALAVPVCCALNVKLLGLRLAEPWIPVAVSAEDNVPALEPKLSKPVRVAAAVGRKFTVTVQLADGVREPAQVVEAKLKSVPDTALPVGVVNVKVPMPVFCRVTTAGVLLPTWVFAKVGVLRVADGACPVPVRLTLVTPAPLWVRLRVPDAAPALVGVNVTLTAQVAPTATEAQLLDCANWVAPELIPTPVNVRVSVPEFVTVTVCTALVELTCCALNVRLEAETLAKASMAVAPRLADCAPEPVLTVSSPVRAVVLVGANLTVTVQLVDGAKEAVHVDDTKLKSVPVTALASSAVTLKGPIPVLAKVASAVLVEPTVVVGKFGVDKVELGACPVPVSDKSETPTPSCVSASVPVKVPAAVGVNETCTVHEALGAKLAQLLDWAKSVAPLTIPTPLKAKVPLPVLVTVTVW